MYDMVCSMVQKMLELNGKYNSAKVFTDKIDNDSIAQIILLCNQEFTKGLSIRMMPDVHAGSGCTVGTTMTIKDKIVPNLVGSDIGCGMETVKLLEQEIDLKALDRLIYTKIPSGFAIRNKNHPYVKRLRLSELRCLKYVDVLKAEKSLGTLGGGNHFIEVDRDDSGSFYLVIHSGSRHLGLEVASYYQKAGYHRLNKSSYEDVQKLTERLKSQNRQSEIESEVKKLLSTKTTSVPKELAYVEKELFEDYVHDMKIVQEYAFFNRKAMVEELLSGMKLHAKETFTTVHNYLDTENMILRKGAVSAQKGEKILIPINMRDGSLICIGKGNPDWNYSAPHGAGRLMSRSEAKELFTVEEYEQEMKGIYSTSVGRGTIDESPMAYKSMEDITENIGDTAEIIQVIRPVYNFKANAEG